jgi:hypothetical protein
MGSRDTENCTSKATYCTVRTSKGQRGTHQKQVFGCWTVRQARDSDSKKVDAATTRYENLWRACIILYDTYVGKYVLYTRKREKRTKPFTNLMRSNPVTQYGCYPKHTGTSSLTSELRTQYKYKEQERGVLNFPTLSQKENRQGS